MLRLAAAVALCVALVALASAADTPYWQEVAFRSVYSGIPAPSALPSVPPAWERLPFRSPATPQAFVSLAPARACTLGLSVDAAGKPTGNLFGSARSPTSIGLLESM